MKSAIKSILLVTAVVMIVGCSSTVPKGMSQDDAKNTIEKMKPEDKIRFYNSSPMPQAEKEAKFREIEQQTGVKASDVLKGQPSLPASH